MSSIENGPFAVLSEPVTSSINVPASSTENEGTLYAPTQTSAMAMW